MRTLYLKRKIAFLFLILLLVGCTVETRFDSKFISLEEERSAVNLVSKTESPVFAKACYTKANYPFFWTLNTEAVLKKIVEKKPQALGLSNAEVTSNVLVTGFFNRVCMEVKGQALYAESADSPP